MSITGVPSAMEDDLAARAPQRGAAPDAPGPRPRETPPRRRRRRLVLVVVPAVLVGSAVLAAAVRSDLQVRSELRQARSSLSTTRTRLTSTLENLSAVKTSLTATTTQGETLRVALDITAWELAGARANLTTTQSSLSNADTGIVTLNTCLGGVEKALNQISVGDQSGAVGSISAVAGSCQAAQGQGGGGPVYPFDFPDPDVVRVGTTYYGYATNSATGNIQMIQSSDLSQWNVLGDAVPHLPSWARSGTTWAPGVFELGGRFLLYYAVDDAATAKQCISVAVAAQPEGPFVDGSTAPLVCQLGLGGSIDPSPFLDGAGTPYLTWKSEGANAQPPTIWSQKLSPSGTALVGTAPAMLLQPSQGWEGGIIEGPFMLLESGRYYLFYSANNWDTADYAIGVAQCQGPTGPCAKPLGQPLVGSQANLSGPGGPSLFTDSQGRLWIAFHAWLPGAVGWPHSRLLFLRQVTFGDGLPVVQS